LISVLCNIWLQFIFVRQLIFNKQPQQRCTHISLILLHSSWSAVTKFDTSSVLSNWFESGLKESQVWMIYSNMLNFYAVWWKKTLSSTFRTLKIKVQILELIIWNIWRTRWAPVSNFYHKILNFSCILSQYVRQSITN